MVVKYLGRIAGEELFVKLDDNTVSMEKIVNLMKSKESASDLYERMAKQL